MALLREGDIIELDDTHWVYTQVPQHFLYSNRRGNWTLAKGEIQLTGQFEYLQGRYVVTKTRMAGGGTGHGAFDVCPDGHEVTCVKVSGEQEVSFYQTGAFTCMIRDIEPVGRAELKWVDPT